MLIRFIGWNLLLYVVFFIGSISFHIYKQNTQEAQTFQETKKKLRHQLEQIESLLSFVGNRVSHATTDEAQKQILQDRYNASIGGKSYPKIFNIYHILNFHTGTSMGGYGRITLEGLPSADFFETLLDSNQKISISTDGKYLNIFSPRITLSTKQTLPTFLMIKLTTG